MYKSIFSEEEIHNSSHMKGREKKIYKAYIRVDWIELKLFCEEFVSIVKRTDHDQKIIVALLNLSLHSIPCEFLKIQTKCSFPFSPLWLGQESVHFFYHPYLCRSNSWFFKGANKKTHRVKKKLEIMKCKFNTFIDKILNIILKKLEDKWIKKY